MTVFTPPKLAKRWSCKPESVIGLLRSGALRGFTVSPPGTKRPRWRVTLDAVLAYEAGDTKPAATKAQPRRRRQRLEAPAGPF